MMKIFEFQWIDDEKEWIAANTIIEAIQTYCLITGIDLIELDAEGDIIELPKEKWSEMKVINTEYDPEEDPDDWEEKTYEEWMKEHTKPDIIAGTMYE